MGTEQQFQQMLELMQGQMTAMQMLQAENTRLSSQQTNINKTKRPDRPVVESGIDDREWALFQDSWKRYKHMANIELTNVNTLRMELRAACTNDVNKLLFELVGAKTLDLCTEEELLNHIKDVAVQTKHKEVHRMEFGLISQNPGERITNYNARLNAKASLCQFTIQCGCDPRTTVSFAEEMVSQQLIAGLANQEHQRKIIPEAESLPTLSKLLKSRP